MLDDASLDSDEALALPLPHESKLTLLSDMNLHVNWLTKFVAIHGVAMPLPEMLQAYVLIGCAGTFGEGEWPQGCLGYACNLVRPTSPGLRARLLAEVLGQTLVLLKLPSTGSILYR